MVKTTQEVEKYISPLLKLLNYPTNTPKWVALRFMLNMSLSIPKDIYNIEDIKEFDGKEYRLTQVTGENKEGEDFTQNYYKMVEAYEDITLRNRREFEKSLEHHIYRGYRILSTSQRENSNIYDFLLQSIINQ